MTLARFFYIAWQHLLFFGAWTVLMLAIGYWAGSSKQPRYIDKLVRDQVEIEHARLIRELAVAKEKATWAGISAQACAATVRELSELTAHEVKVVMMASENGHEK